MKKRITTSFIFFLLLSLINISFGQDSNDKNNSIIKENFYKQYLVYKNNLANGIVMTKPIDPSGLYTIDENNNFAINDNSVGKTVNNYSQAPWINGQPDLISVYTWSQPVGTYTTITGGAGTVVITAVGVDDNVYSLLPVGFTFNFDGVDYTQFGLCSNGWISMGSTAPTNSYTPISTGTTRNIVSAMSADLLGQATGRIEYQTSGTAPNRVLTVQWSTWAFYNGGVVDGSTLNFQIKLFETTNNIQLIWGTNTSSAISHTVQVGLSGAATTDFNNRTTTTNWSATTAGTLNTSTCTMFTGIVPATNLTFQWAPPPPVPMTYVSSTTAQITPGLNIPQSSINNQILQVQVVMSGTLSPISMTNLNFNTTGSTNPSDFANAKVYYTGTSNVFATTTLFGTTATPSGAFTVTGSQPMSAGTNYFWLTYDATAGAVIGDTVDAQTVTIVGSGTMGTQTPTVTNPAGRRQIDNYCRGTYTTMSFPFGIYITNLSIGSINNTSSYDPDGNFPYAYSWFVGQSATLEQGVTYPISASTFSSSNPQGFAVWVDWDNNNSFDASEWTAFPLVTSGGPVVTSTFITVPPGASVGNHRMRIRNSLSTPPTSAQPCALLSYGETEDYTVNVTPAVPMVYTSSTTTQTVLTGFYAPQTNLNILGVQVVTAGSLSPFNLTSFTFNTNGSTNPATDITNAKVWYTGINPAFATTTQFGSTYSGPSGSFVVSGSRALLPGTNYFWITYDIPATATALNFVDAECNSITGSGTMGTVTPTVQAPAGNRQILGSAMCGAYTIPGSYASIAAAVADLNLKGVSCATVFNIASGYTETMPAGGYVINASGSSAVNTITFQRFGASMLPNPLISTTVAGLGTVTVSTFGSNGDAFFKLNGTDFVTFDGIDMIDLYTGAVTGPKIEYGIMLCKPAANDGCKNITIKNCNITFALTNTTAVSAGVYTSNYSSAGSIITTTSIPGRHENIFIDGNNIYNTITGMYFDGTTDAVSPYNLYTNNVQVGVNAGNTMICGSRTTTNAVTQYGIYTIYNDSMKIINNTIRCNTGNNTPTTYGIFTSTGTNSSIDIINNDVSDSLMYTTAATSTQQAGIYNSFGQTPTTASNVINIKNNTVHDCVYPTSAAPSIFYIANVAGAYTVNITGNTVTNNYMGGGALGTATGTQYGIYNSATINVTAGSTYNVANNNVNNIIRTQSAVGAGTTYGIYVGAGSLVTNIDSNNVNTITLNTTTGTLAGIYMLTTITNGTLNVFSNTVNNLSRTLNVTTGITYLLYTSQSTATSNVYNNTLSNFNQPVATSTGAVYGTYDNGVSPVAVNFYNNSISNISRTGTGAVYGVWQSNGTTALKNVYGNTINNISSGTGTTGGLAIGLLIGYGTTGNIYRNKVYNVTSYNSTGLSPAAAGLILQTSGTNFYVYNNYIQEIKAPAATLATTSPSVVGIYHNIATAYLFYNTVYLDATSTGANFGSAALLSNTTYTLDARNNILINKSTPTGTGKSAAYQRSTNLLTSYATLSDRNNLYAGTPGINNVLFYDGTNSDQTIAAYRTRVGPTRDANSLTENTAFVNTAVPPYDLHLTSCALSQVESNAGVVSLPISIIADFDGNARYPNAGFPACSTYAAIAPDIGADEFDGQFVDAVPPSISYLLLGNGNVAASRLFSSVAVTDPSGINTTAGTKPRVYYKKFSDANAWADNTNCTNGWKWVEASGTSSPFSFTIDYTKLYDPACVNGQVITGDTIQYFVVAQDLAGIPNVGINSGTFPGSPTSVADYANIIPLGGTINRYTISGGTYSGNYNIGTGQTFLSITGSTQGFFQALNSGVVTGNITAFITSDLTEDGTNQLGSLSYDVPGANYTITIKPFDATEKVISGSTAAAMISFTGGDYITIDGNGGLANAYGSKYVNGGLDLTGTKYLRFRNTSAISPTFSFTNDSRGNTIKNCIIESNNATLYTGSTPGTIFFGSTAGSGGNDSNTITENDIRDRSDLAGIPGFGVFSLGNIGSQTLFNSNNTISNNNIYNYGPDNGSFSAGIWLENGNRDWTISGNSFYQTATRTMTLAGATHAGLFTDFNSQHGMTVTGNYFGGSAPICGGTAMTYTGAVTFSVEAFDLFVGGQLAGEIASSVQNNTVQNINLSTTNAGISNFFRGIRATSTTGLVNIGNVTGNTIGNTTSTGNITLTVNTSVSTYLIYAIEHSGFGSISNNTIGSFTLGGSGTLLNFRGISVVSTPLAAGIFTIANNIIGSNTTPGSIQNTVDAVRGTSSRGISATVNIPGTLSCTGNTVANWNFPLSNSLVSSTVNGVQTLGTGNHTISGNTVHDLSLETGYASFTNMLCGFQPAQTVGAAVLTFTQNTVYNLFLTNTGAFSSFMEGVLVTGGNPGSVISRNRIYNLTNQQTGPAPTIVGIGFFNAANIFADVTNNMISLTNGEPTDNIYAKLPDAGLDIPNDKGRKDQTSVQEFGTSNTKQKPQSNISTAVDYTNTANDIPVADNVSKNKQNEKDLFTNGMVIEGFEIYNAGNLNLYYNSVYVGGTAAAGANNTAALRRFTGAGTVNLKNNLFINARTGGGGKNYVINNELGSTGWSGTSSNYNVYLGSNPSTIGQWTIGVDQDIDQWRVTTGGDKQTWSTTTAAINPSNLLTGIATGNLNIQSGNLEAWLVSGKGIALTGQNIDFTGDARVTAITSGVTDIGADEFAATPPSNPVATQNGTPGAGLTTTYTLYGRTICSIDWGNGGTSYPTSMNVNYYSGINPPTAITSPNRNSSSYWTAVPVGSLSGTTYGVTLNFGDNETYNITSPNTNVLLAKYNTFWQAFPGGSGEQFSDLNWSALKVTTQGLNTFSTFALTDAALPSIVLVSPANNSIATTLSPTLVWNRSAGSTTHRVQLATDSLFNTIIRDTTTADTTKLISGLIDGSNYWWRLYGTNGVGTGAWSQIFKFKAVNPLSPPPPPALFSPANNAVGQNLSLTLVWFKSSLAVSYRAQLATDSLFTNIIVDDSTLTDSTRVVSGLTPLTNYWWRVNAKNPAGTSAFSSAFKFRTLGAPTQVTLLNPPNNATGQPISINFRWSRASDQLSPLGGDIGKTKTLVKNGLYEKSGDEELVSNYWWELTTDTVSFANLQRDTTLTDTTKTASVNYATTYFWRARAKNQVGWGAYSVWFRFTTGPLPPALVNLTVIPGGFYNTGTNQLNMKDTIIVYLVDSVTCLKVDSSRGVLDSVNFTMPLSFGNAATGNYYLIVYHRNHLGVATRFKQNVVRGSAVSYDFTTDSAKAFGFNMVKVSTSPVRWGMIPGDANKDGFIDAIDQSIWVAQNGLDGYLAADFNGDGFVDAIDQAIWVTFNGLSSFLPCGFTLDPGTMNLIENAPSYDAKKGNKIMFERKQQENRIKNENRPDNNNNRK